MANYILDALEIITDDGRGVPVTYSNSALGLMSDGHFALITGRPTITTATGDSTRTDWVSGILDDEPGDFQPSEFANFVEAGCFQEIGDMEFSIDDVGNFLSTCEANGVFLGRCRVIYYRVTSSDGSTWNFKRRWTGVIDEIPFDKLTAKFKCISNAEWIFKSTPIQPVNPETYPKASRDSQEKVVPIAMGYVAHSPLVNVASAGEKVELTEVDGIKYKLCAAFAYGVVSGVPTLSLYTGGPFSLPGILFEKDDYRLVNKYLSVVVGKEQKVRIVGNSKSYAPAYIYQTDVYLAEPLDQSEGSDPNGNPFIDYLASSHPENAWFFEVEDLKPTFIASQKPIAAFGNNPQGRPALSQYDSQARDFKDISEIAALTSLTNIEATGNPGISAIANSAESSDLNSYFPIYPEKIILNDESGWDAVDSDFVVGADLTALRDKSDSNVMDLVVNDSGSPSLTLDVYLPVDDRLKEFKELYLLPDFVHFCVSNSAIAQVKLTAYPVDIYGRSGPAIQSNVTLENTVVAAARTRHHLPRSYVNASGDDTLYYQTKASLNVAAFLNNTKKSAAYNLLRVVFNFTIAGGGLAPHYTFRLQELGVVGKRSISITSEPVYANIKGEVAGTTWDGRTSPDFHFPLLPMGMEHLIRNYDISAPVWQAGKAYVVGDKVRGTADTGHIFICTVAGTSHASTEPSWTDTTGATYTDGTVTWKEFFEIPIDTASFTTASFARLQWLFGRTLTEIKSSFEWYKEICAHGFFIGIIDRFGKVKLKPWRQQTTPLITFSGGVGGNILEGTFNEMPVSETRLVYNDIFIRYDYNYATGKYNKNLFITKIDQPAFPAANETISTETDLGAFTAEGQNIVTSQLIAVTTVAPHGLVSGDYTSLKGNVHGYDYTLFQVSVVDAYSFFITGTGNAFTATTSSSGKLVKNSNLQPKWKTYVGGFINYARAKAAWEQCNASYKVTKTINKLPSNLADCPWFFDPYAMDQGRYIWSDDGGKTPVLDVGDDHAAVLYAEELVAWNPWPKKMPTFEIPYDSTVEDLEIGDTVNVVHPKLSQGLSKLGWIHEITPLPRDEDSKLPERLRFGVTLKPDQLVDHLIIDEDGADGSLIYDEDGATDDIEENGA